MYNEVFCNNLQDVLESEENIALLAEAKDVNSLKAIFLNLGIDLADEELQTVFSQLNEINNSDELTEDMLDAVSGGCILCGIALAGGCVVAAYIVFKVGKWIVDRKYGK